MARALKVFRTSVGFYDAYVAAPSQKAALEAWGADANLFAQGLAEIVSDGEVMKAPLAHPGKVIKVARGTTAEHLAALPNGTKAVARRDRLTSEDKTTSRSLGPRPTRKGLTAAEATLARAQRRFSQAFDTLRKREEKLEKERRKLNSDREAALTELSNAVELQRNAYEQAIEAWAAGR